MEETAKKRQVLGVEIQEEQEQYNHQKDRITRYLAVEPSGFHWRKQPPNLFKLVIKTTSRLDQQEDNMRQTILTTHSTYITCESFRVGRCSSGLFADRLIVAYCLPLSSCSFPLFDYCYSFSSGSLYPFIFNHNQHLFLVVATDQVPLYRELGITSGHSPSWCDSLSHSLMWAGFRLLHLLVDSDVL